MNKIYSQGIILPLEKVKKFLESQLDSQTEYIDKIWEEGMDLTKELMISKYIPPTQKGGGLGFMQSKGDFPINVVAKTDEDNLASRKAALFELEGKAVYFTLKSEGSSCTALINPDTGDFDVCTRNNIIKEHEGSKFWQAVNKYNLKETLPELYPNIVIQGELVGPGVQANHHTLTEPDLHVFTMTDISDNRRRLNLTEMYYVAEDLGLTLVKRVYQTDNFRIQENFPIDDWHPSQGVYHDTVWTFDRLQLFADVQVYDNGTPAEGIVIRPHESFPSQKLKTSHWSGKIINRDYKL